MENQVIMEQAAAGEDENAQRFRELVEKAPLGIVLTDIDHNILYVNQRFVELSGYDMAEVPNIDAWWRLACPSEDYRLQSMKLWQRNVQMSHQSGRDINPFERRIACRDQSARVIEFRYMPMGTHGVTIVTDITDRKRLEEELTVMATSDPLTGAMNRRKFMEVMNYEFERYRRYGRDFSILMLDIDHFKKVNDIYGHQGGDEVLKALTRMCRDALRNCDHVCRLGGEEFALILPETGREGAIDVAERVRLGLGTTPVQTPEASICYTVSIGVSWAEIGDDAIDKILKRADAALYDAKREGRNRVCVK